MKILIAEDQLIFHDTITNILYYIERDIEIYFTTTPEETIAQINRFIKKGITLDLIISDLQFQNGNKSFEIVDFCVSKNLPIAVFSMFENKTLIKIALNMGVIGFISKNENPEDIIDGLRMIINKQSYLSPNIQNALDKNSLTWELHPLDLTNSERNLLYCLSRGMTMKEVEIELKINENTLRTHRRNMMKKNNCTYEKLLACFNLFPPVIEFELTTSKRLRDKLS